MVDKKTIKAIKLFRANLHKDLVNWKKEIDRNFDIVFLRTK